MTSALQVRCPNCGKSIAWTPENAWRPFCCERCKLIDLGAWADEKYAIPEANSAPTLDQAPEDPH